MKNIRPGSAKFFSKKKKKKRMLPEISVILARRASISSMDRSVAEQAGIFSKPWVLGAKAAQRVCVNISTRSRGHVEEKRIYSFCVPLKKKSTKLMMSVFCSNSLIHAPECGKCILRDPNFQNFPWKHAPGPPLEARAFRRSLKTPSASFSLSPPTSQILPSTPFLIENPGPPPIPHIIKTT